MRSALTSSSSRRRGVGALVALGLTLVSCGDDADPAATPAATETDTDVVADGPAGVVRVDPATAAETIAADDDIVIIDVRTPEEYAEGHVEGAVLIDIQAPDFTERIGELDRDADYVVYCRSGNRSDRALAIMDDLGFTSVRDVAGGVVAWDAAGLPLTSG